MVMKHQRLLSSVVASVMLLAACAGPYYERAKVVQGWSCGGGLGLTGGNRLTTSGMWPESWLTEEVQVSGLATGFARYGFSDKASVFLQASTGLGLWIDQDGKTQQLPAYEMAVRMADVQLGGKFMLNRHSAIRVNVGLLDIVDIAYIADAGPEWSGGLGIGLRGLSFFMTRHDYFAPRLLGHTSFTLSAIPPFPRKDDTWTPGGMGAFLGFGLERLPRHY